MESSSGSLLARSILFLEDDPDFAVAGADAMREAGLRVLMALHPWDALQHIDSGQPIDLFLSDIRMPRDTPHGFAMARMARFRAPKLKVLFVTAHRELAEGADARLGRILFKPIHPARLVEEVHNELAAD